MANDTMHEMTPRARRMRQTIYTYIQARFEAKVEKLKPDTKEGDAEEYAKQEAKYVPAVWLAGAAKRIAGIQVVTHPLKATHSRTTIKTASSLFVRPDTMGRRDVVSSAVLGNAFAEDVTGNAAALDVYDFLQQEMGGKRVFEHCQCRDEDFLCALNDDLDEASEWVDAFARITEPRTSGVASEDRAKQLYWFADAGKSAKDNDAYILVSPLYPMHLSHRIYEVIQEHRYSKEAKAARKARWDGKPSEDYFYEYGGLGVIVIGGSNTQNVSQLNSSHRGTNYMLSCAPPTWREREHPVLWGARSLFERFEKRRDTRELLKSFRTFLEADPAANVQTRRRVRRYVDHLIDGLVAFAIPYQENPDPWTADASCRLSMAQKCWLNPQRAVLDEDFYNARTSESWMEQLGADFGRWLNGQLDGKLPVGDLEFRRWQKEFDIEDHWVQEIERARASLSVATKQEEAHV